MSTNLTVRDNAEQIERVLIDGNLSTLKPEERVQYYKMVCDSVGLNPLTKPFDYINLNGKLTLYARKDATDQLRNIHNVSVNIVAREIVEGCYVVTSKARMANGREDESIGAVPIDNLKGEARANAMMKCETKSKRRVTLSICGLGILDETEIETIPSAKPEVARITEDIPLTKSAAHTPVQAVEHSKGPGPTEAAETLSVNLCGFPDCYIKGAHAHATGTISTAASEPSSAEATALPASSAAVEYISIPQQREFHKACRLTHPPEMRAKIDNATYQWLMDNHYLNGKGEPSASAIPVKDWPAAKDKAAKWVGVQ